jgi:hypothetical protein
VFEQFQLSVGVAERRQVDHHLGLEVISSACRSNTRTWHNSETSGATMAAARDSARRHSRRGAGDDPRYVGFT